MSNHFIKNIEIKNFKCFKDFKAEGFGRVNLISGQNNVGKTAFMEACYLLSYYATNIQLDSNFEKNYGARGIERDLIYFWLIKSIIVIEQNRHKIDFISEWIKDEIDFNTFYSFELTMNNKFKLKLTENHLMPQYKYYNWSNYGSIELSNFRQNKYFYTINKINHPPKISNSIFISPSMTTHSNLKNMIDTLKIENKYDYINTLFNEIFEIEKIDVIKDKVMLFQNKQFKDLNYFGDGLKYFLNIILSLLVNKDTVIYLDEIENGIHYSLLDKLWEIILKISKEQNVQVFATTHSKECIESYARVAKRLEDEDIKFIKMTKLKDSKIIAGVRDYDMLQYTMSDGHEVRGV